MRLEDLIQHEASLDRSLLRVGISACLLGEKVRYDGGHKRSRLITDLLGDYFSFVPVCPETELGLGIPRETLRLEREGEEDRLRAPASGTDHTEAMLAYAHRRVDAIEKEDLDGFILKKNSPSCGLYRVKSYRNRGMPERDARGLFARVLCERMPQLPVEEEGRLQDAVLRESFVERVYAHRRLALALPESWQRKDLVAFHTREKLLLMAHSPDAYRRLGRLVADLGTGKDEEIVHEYRRLFLEGMAEIATRGRQVNVLQHIAGYLRDGADEESRREVRETIEGYGAGIVPMVVPLTLLRHWVRRLDLKWLAVQSYFEPQPDSLMLRTYLATSSRK